MDELPRQKDYIWFWWSLSPPIQGNFNLLSLFFSFSFPLSFSFVLFFWLSFRFFFCYRDINSVLLTLFYTVLWMFLSTFNDLNVYFRDQNVFRLLIRNIIFFRILLFKFELCVSIVCQFINIIFQVTFHSI